MTESGVDGVKKPLKTDTETIKITHTTHNLWILFNIKKTIKYTD
jgi:hypothetical protein